MVLPENDYMTGACLTVDGGMSLGRGLAGEMEPEKVKRSR